MGGRGRGHWQQSPRGNPLAACAFRPASLKSSELKPQKVIVFLAALRSTAEQTFPRSFVHGTMSLGEAFRTAVYKEPVMVWSLMIYGVGEQRRHFFGVSLAVALLQGLESRMHV